MGQSLLLGLIGGKGGRCCTCTAVGIIIFVVGCCSACCIIIGGRVLLSLCASGQLTFDDGAGESVDIVFIFLPVSGELHLIIMGAVFVIQLHIGEFHLAGCETGIFQSYILGFISADIIGHSVLAASGQNQKTKRCGAYHYIFSCHSSGLLSCF